MAKEFRASVESSTGQILYGQWSNEDGSGYDVNPGLSLGQTRVVLASEPDRVRERWDGSAIRQATAQEMRDHGEAQQDAVAQGFANRIPADLKAVLIVALWQTLGHKPTDPEIAEALRRVKRVYLELL